MNGSGANVGRREEHIPGKLALDTKVPRLGVRSVALVTIEGMDGGSVAQRGTKWRRGDRWDRIAIPRAVSRSSSTGRADGEVPREQAQERNSRLVGAELERATVQVVQSEPGENDGSSIQLVSESQAGTGLTPVNVAVIKTGANRAGTEFGERAGQGLAIAERA